MNEQTWQWINTAPKDGTEYLGYRHKSGLISVASWIDGAHRGQVEQHILSVGGVWAGYPITHWRPLPTPPYVADVPLTPSGVAAGKER